jgi:1-deoxy-D-xylulose-5-phosphate reductoisomerase
MIDLVILGSTGSIGVQALNIVRNNPDKFRVVGLAAAGNNLQLLVSQINEFRPDSVAVSDKTKKPDFLSFLRAPVSFLRRQESSPSLGELKNSPSFGRGGTEGDGVVVKEQDLEILYGIDGVEYLAGSKGEVVLNGITGSIGLTPTLAALESGKYLALANKESLICGNRIVIQAKQFDDQIIPVDSEHSAIYQCLGLTCSVPANLSKLILTASGGPFYGKTVDELQGIKPSDALKHPTWDMGRVVTINSSTLVNKSLELLEASLLFGVDIDKIDITVHRQSVVHSMIEYTDGATISQMGIPNMELPISIGLNKGQRLDQVVEPYNWNKESSLTFGPVDNEAFPAIELMRRAIRSSPLHPTVFNSANEVLVDQFCDGKIPYLDIVRGIEQVLDKFDKEFTTPIVSPSIDDIWEAEVFAKTLVKL